MEYTTQETIEEMLRKGLISIVMREEMTINSEEGHKLTKEEKLAILNSVEKAMVRLAYRKSKNYEETLSRLTLNEDYQKILKKLAELAEDKD